MRYTVVLRYIGTALLLISFFEAVAACISLYDGMDSSFRPLLFSALLSFTVGAFPRLFVRPVQKLVKQEASLIVLGAWVVSCLFGLMPYLFWGEMSLVDALFESVSGFTTTGASILEDIEALPRGLLFWRMTTSWIGGMGIIVFSTILLPSMSRMKSALSGIESASLGATQTPGGYHITAYSVLAVYVSLTIACTLSLKAVGLNWFDSLNHAMSTISTCGFSTKNASIAYYDSVAVYSVITFFMFVAGISFSLMWAWLVLRTRNLRWDVVRWYSVFTLIGICICTISLVRHGVGFGNSLMQSAFHVVSLTTTTGFAIVDTNMWPSLAMTVLVVCSIVCACSGSTTGGIKMDRLIIASKTISQHLRKIVRPNVVHPITVNGKPVSSDDSHSVMIFIVLYFAVLFAGFLANTASGMDMVSGFSASVACLGNVGPGFGDVGSFDNYAAVPTASKIYSVMLMLLGRLEIVGVVRLFFSRQKVIFA